MLRRWLGSPNGCLQTSYVYRFIINHSYCSNSCLLYSPHLIAITTIYLAFVLNPSAQVAINHLLPSFSVDDAAENSPPSTKDPGIFSFLIEC
ncbi:hypothetical protein K435DRAFT_466279 [Dendrothele bispora CBS 962.96]|uniref:Uncharacterized protein n=1 Tax=Dendrothele bispora (strain CBS 962.96) TaxID=1314807 RepID=A0A4S8MCU6_DENBC|nr:hypothetical protein K435DRAFT_466279 [Dendrothele bispora CBS 962.96]